MKAIRSPRILAPEGVHIARVVNIIYLGTIKGSFGDAFKVRISFELPNETHVFKEGEKALPFMVSKETTLSMGKKSNLRPLVEGVIGTSLDDEEAYAFDIDQLLNMTCQLHIVHEESENGKYVQIKSASPLLKGVTCPPPVNSLQILSYEKWDQAYFDALPQYLREKMEKTPEYNDMKYGKGSATVDPDDVPFN